MSNEPTTITIEPLNPDAVGEQIVAVERANSLPEDAAVALRDQFAAYYTGIVDLRAQAATITKPDDKTQQKLARTVRLGLKSIRCDVERVRKQLKEESLRRGKAIDGFANVLKYLCEPVESKLEDIEKYAERQEAARIAALVAERSAAIAAIGADPTAYNLAVMDDDTFRLVVAGLQKAKEEREEAARKAEAERVAREEEDRKERERIKAENERLRLEAQMREAAAMAERASIEAERAKERAEAERIQREQEAKARKEREAAEAKLRAERAAREKAEREAAAARRASAERVAAEHARIEAEAEAKREAAEKAARAPDKVKFRAFVASLRALSTGDMATNAGKALARQAMSELIVLAEKIERAAEGL